MLGHTSAENSYCENCVMLGKTNVRQNYCEQISDVHVRVCDEHTRDQTLRTA
jgi:hypothetical protein